MVISGFFVVYLFFIIYSKPTVGQLQIQIILQYQILHPRNRFHLRS